MVTDCCLRFGICDLEDLNLCETFSLMGKMLLRTLVIGT